MADTTAQPSPDDSGAPSAPADRMARMMAAIDRDEPGDSSATEPTDAQAEAPDERGDAQTDTADPTPQPEPERAPDRSWDALERRDRELLEREQRVKGAMAELEPMAKAAAALKSGDRLAAAKALGLDPAQLAAEFWGEEKTPEQKEKEAQETRFERLERELKESRELAQRLAQEREQEREHMTLREIIDSSSDDELGVIQLMAKSKGLGARFLDDIRSGIREERDRMGHAPDMSDYLKRTEETIFEQYTQSFKELASVKKFRQAMVQALQLGESDPKPAPPKSAPPARRPPQTISSDTQEAAMSTPKPKTRAERMARAAAVLEHGIPKD